MVIELPGTGHSVLGSDLSGCADDEIARDFSLLDFDLVRTVGRGFTDDFGADILFTPEASEVYPDGFATTVTIRGITETLCGDPSRRGHQHFDGVTTVVAKLFNMVAPTRAYFGQKDAQQVAVIRKLVRDLDFRVEVIACPIIREADGLALSSRNVYLSAEDRVRALSLSRALHEEVKFDTEKTTGVDWITHPSLRHADVPARIDIVLVNGDPKPDRPDLPHYGAGETIFAVARSAGWIAHGLEEYPHRLRYRIRATYTGPEVAS